jgi:uncharacterized membrane protein HdeD (DUF308 family)/alpha-beta hydrolase superfamily lysophospholipase
MAGVSENPNSRRLRWRSLAHFVSHAPPWVTVVIGAGALLLGLLVVTRPLTSLVLLAVYVALSAIATGVAEVVRPRGSRWASRLLAIVWVALGLGILLGLRGALQILPAAIAVLLLLGGLTSLADAVARGRISERVLAAAWGGSQIVFVVLSFTWPDVTVLVVAVVFGLRTIVFGATQLIRVVRQSAVASRSPARDAADERGDRRLRAWQATGRYALAAVLVTASAGGWWVNEWLEDGAPVVDAFYTPPEVVPYEHGRLIRVDDYAGRAPAGGEVRRILYTTRDAAGQPAIGSGLVISPVDPPRGARPVVMWHHGTTGVARGCAPSLRDDAATRWAIPALDDAMAQGWIVVATDYSGQGAPGVFPYLIGTGEARSSLDAVLAAREIDGLILSKRTMAWGHSQGGHAALWAARIAADYAPDVDVLGVAALAPAAEPLELAEELTSGDPNVLLAILISWVLVPYADTYDDVELSRYLAPGAAPIVREMTQRCPSEPGVVVSVATALGVSADNPLYATDLTAGPLGRRLADNAATGPWDMPLLVAWGSADEVIPPSLQQDFVTRACADDTRLRRLVYDDYEHLQILLPGSRFLPVLMRWSDERFQLRDLDRDDCAG